MHEKIYTRLGILITWFVIFFIVPLMGFDINIWVLIVSASIGGLFAGLLVQLGETVFENIILVLVFLVLAGVLWGYNSSLGFIFISVLISSVIGVITNQVNQYAANKDSKQDRHKAAPPS